MPLNECETLDDLRRANYIRSYYNMTHCKYKTPVKVVIIKEAFIEHEVSFGGNQWTDAKIKEYLTKLFSWK